MSILKRINCGKKIPAWGGEIYFRRQVAIAMVSLRRPRRATGPDGKSGSIESPCTFRAKVCCRIGAVVSIHSSAIPGSRLSIVSRHAPALTHEISGTAPRTGGPGATLEGSCGDWESDSGISPRSCETVTPKYLASGRSVLSRGSLDSPDLILEIVGCGTPVLSARSLSLRSSRFVRIVKTSATVGMNCI